MNYTENPKPENTAMEVKEPVAAYYTSGVGNAIAEPDEFDTGDDWDDGIDWDAVGAPERVTVRSYEELCQKLEEAEEDERAGRVRPLEDWWSDFKRNVDNEAMFQELEKVEARRLAGAKTYSIAEISEFLLGIINGKN